MPSASFRGQIDQRYRVVLRLATNFPIPTTVTSFPLEINIARSVRGISRYESRRKKGEEERGREERKGRSSGDEELRSRSERWIGAFEAVHVAALTRLISLQRR